MNIPATLDRATLRKLAALDETHCVRVILHKVSNTAPYTLRSRLRRYIFERDGVLGAHVLDIPVSVWMAKTPTGAHRQNESVAFDLQPSQQFPFTIQIIPWQTRRGASAVQQASGNVFPLLDSFAKALGAPPVMSKAIDLAAKGDAKGLQAMIDQANSKPDTAPPTGPITAQAAKAERTRLMREAKARKKAEREAKLQPA